jgi:UDP-GlcNAc:undecaprenyl-phosphate GlcNAc-1-phosphate transferase
MFGGVAIFLTVAGSYHAFVPHSPQTFAVMAASSFLFLVGLVDDLLHIKPYQKLIGQMMGAAMLIYFGSVTSGLGGLTLPWTGSVAVNMAVTIFWLIGITNAVNLLDNMDGLAAGIAAIASLFLAFNFGTNGQTTEALMLALFAAALVGFLVYNSNPASIFMGDCGSMFIGFFLASSALLSASGERGRSFIVVIAVPVLILFIPIFDTTLVTVVRKLSGRAASQGGRDHTSHRLVALGLSERRAVWMLYTFAVAGGALSMLVRRAALDVSVGAIAAFVVALTFLGVYLARVRVYSESEAGQRPAVFTFLLNVSYKRRVFEVALDVILIVLSYYCAHALVLGPAAQTSEWRLFLQTLPLVLAVKLAALLAAGVYRGLWRYASVHDMARYTGGVALGTVVSVIFAGAVGGFAQLKPSVFVIDAMLLLLAMAGSRFGFRLVHRVVPVSQQPAGRRVVIYGAGDGGELLFRELRNNRELQRVPVAFVDDDPGKAGRMLHGLVIISLNGAASVAAICRALGAEELLVSTSQVPQARLRDIVDECERAGVAVKRMSIDLRALTQESLARA